MHALVTGATGFLGRYLVQRLRAHGYSVRALVRSREKARTLDQTGAEISFGDVTVPETLKAAVKNTDVIFHAAALVSNWAPWAQFVDVTVRGTENLLAAAAASTVRRFVHISTVRVYDDRYCNRNPVVLEDAPHGDRGCRHFGHYAFAKVLAEQAVWRSSDILDVTVLRPAWIYGPGDETILPPLLSFLGCPIAFWPSWADACADPVHADDVAEAAILAATSGRAVDQAYNIAPATRIGMRMFLGGLCEAMGIAPPKYAVPYWLSASAARVCEWLAKITFRRQAPLISRAGLAILTLDNHFHSGRAQRDLGWYPRVTLHDGIGGTAAWCAQTFLRVDPNRTNSVPVQPAADRAIKHSTS